jgi:hypothetical protein
MNQRYSIDPDRHASQQRALSYCFKKSELKMHVLYVPMDENEDDSDEEVEGI